MKALWSFTMLLLLSYNAQAQFNLKDKILKSLDPQKKDSVQIQSNPDGSSTIKTNDAEIKIEESTNADIRPNTFLGSFVMNFENTSNGKKSTGKIEYYFKEWASMMIPNFEENKDMGMKMLFDHKKLTTTMLTVDKKGKKSGIITKTPKITVTTSSPSQAMKEGKLVKTGEKKVIEGYNCEKWLYNSEDSKSEFWVTTNIKYNLSQALALFNTANKGGKSPKNNFDKIEGFCMEGTTTSSNGDIYYFTITQLKIGEPSSDKFSTEGYEIMDMSSFGNMFGQ